ncbi:MAG: hypothetical protein CVU42_13790 [Chloroflexi bacterium HGW-Chloroflexi-4]|jgi:hypothetical protein|nr:MAG: hypothetical protein CVU42_13790 [Chloroflexi bacterium HGW-Chloroflexi-4]
MSDELVDWKCPNGHILGKARKTGRGAHQLILYRNAVDFTAEDPKAVEVIAVIRGQGMDIRCDICDAKRTWAAKKKLPNGVVPTLRGLAIKTV